MNRTAKFSRCCSSTTCARISFCTTTSSAVVGSSMITTSGSAASAIAIIDPLAHAAGQLVRVAAQTLARDPDEVEQLAEPLLLLLAPELEVRVDRVAELIAHAQHRVQRVHRALEDDRDLAPAQLAQLARALLHQVDAARRKHGCRGRRRCRW